MRIFQKGTVMVALSSTRDGLGRKSTLQYLKLELTKGGAIALDSIIETLEKEGVVRPIRAVKFVKIDFSDPCVLKTTAEIWPTENHPIVSVYAKISCYGSCDGTHNWMDRSVSVQYQDHTNHYFACLGREELEFIAGEVEL